MRDLEKKLKSEYGGWEQSCGIEDWSEIEERFLKAFNMKSIHG